MLACFLFAGLRERRAVERAEARAESDQLRIGERLPANHDHEVIERGLVDRGVTGGVQRPHVAAAHLGAENGLGRDDFDRHGFHCGNG